MLDDIYRSDGNNAVFQFSNLLDAREWLKDQWSGLFRDLLVRRARQQQLSALSEQVQQLEDLSITIEVYLQELVNKLSPQSERIISHERNRRFDAKTRIALQNNRLLSYLSDALEVPIEDLQDLVASSQSVEEFLQRATERPQAANKVPSQKIIELSQLPLVKKDFEAARNSLPPQPGRAA